MAKNKQFKTKHKFFGVLFRPIYRLVSHCSFKIKLAKIKLDGPTLILSNHQTDLDAIMLMGSANKHIEPVCLDTLLSNGATSKFLYNVTGMIPKKKGTTDINCVVKMMQCLKEGGNVLVFPEGNRTYAEFQFPFNESVFKLVRKTNASLVIVNIHNGTGVNPRWGSKKRKGTIWTEIKTRFTPEELKNISDSDLFEIVKRDLEVFDSDTGIEYKSDAPAEYLERLLYVCPECKSLSKLKSEKDTIACTECNTVFTYLENLTFKENKYGYRKLIDWYNFQKSYIRDWKYDVHQLIFEDDVQDILEYRLLKKRKSVATGKIKLFGNKLVFGENMEVDLSKISAASPISGNKLSLLIGDKSYLVIGSERFNPVKYVQMFNHLETEMKQKKSDTYFTLD